MNPLTCGNKCAHTATKECVEGCFCPNGKAKYNGKCVEAQTCPCHMGNDTQFEENPLTEYLQSGSRYDTVHMARFYGILAFRCTFKNKNKNIDDTKFRFYI